jgi:two-component system, chemotaxis family, chemotaxis protein CheY
LNLNVLVVDDSAAIRKILLRVLSQSDLPIDAVSEANDGLEALKVLETTPVNLVLSDINMPNMDGLDFLTKVRANARWKDLIILMVTTEGSQAKVLEAVRLGANGYVRKPFTSDQIKDKVMSCLKERAA